MTKPKPISTDADSQLKLMGIVSKGFERYESDAVLIEGQPDNRHYRWRITFKRTGRTDGAMSLIEAIQKIKAALVPNLQPPAPGPKLSMTAGNAKRAAAPRKRKDDQDQFGLGLSEADL